MTGRIVAIMAAAAKINLEIFTPAPVFSVPAGKDFRIGEFREPALAGVSAFLP